MAKICASRRAFNWDEVKFCKGRGASLIALASALEVPGKAGPACFACASIAFMKLVLSLTGE